MFRRTAFALAVALAVPAVAAAHDDEFDEDWGWIDDDHGRVETYEYEADVAVDEPNGSISIETFDDGLRGYGEWVQVGAYGRVWRPVGVAAGWRPYYRGHWEWSDEGWFWVSAEPWGWATYHYGRWAHDPFYGWVWVPGYQWAPAWVTWRFGGDFIGWAPLGPGLSVYVTNYPAVYDYWCFVPSARFVAVPVHTVAYVGGPRVRGIYDRTRPAPPRSRHEGVVAPAWGGPARPFVEKRIGRPISPVRVQAVATPRAVSGPTRAGVVNVYRPERRAPAAPSRAGAVSSPGDRSAPMRPGRSDTAAVPGSGGRSSGSAVAPARPDRSSEGAVAPPAPRSSGSVAAPPSRSGSSSSGSVAPPSRGGGSVGAPPRSGGMSSGGGSSGRGSGGHSPAPPRSRGDR